MKADDAHQASILVSEERKIALAIDKLLTTENDGTVYFIARTHTHGNGLAELYLPPTYLAKALQEYRDAVVLKAQALGVVFGDPKPL